MLGDRVIISYLTMEAIPSGMNRIPIAVACIDLGAAVMANSKPTIQEYLLKQ